MNMHSLPSLGGFSLPYPPPIDLAERKASAARLTARHNAEIIANRRANVEAPNVSLAVDDSKTGGL